MPQFHTTCSQNMKSRPTEQKNAPELAGGVASFIAG